MRIPGVLALLATVLGLPACSGQDSTLVKPAEMDQPSAVAKKSLLRRKVVSLLERKHYRQALELMNGKSHDGLEKEYVTALNGQLEAGDDAFALGDYGAAAHAFKMALSAYPAEPALREQITRDSKQIRTSLDACVNRLMEQGLQEYRRGRLESAIRKWKMLLAVSPGHQEAKKALNTATVQLQALQNLKNM